MSRSKILPYACIEEVRQRYRDKHMLVVLKGPVFIHPEALLNPEEYFTYTEDPGITVDPGTFQVTLDFGTDERLRRKLRKQYHNDHI